MPAVVTLMSKTDSQHHNAQPAWVSLAAVMAISAIFILLRWKKLDSILWGDPVHWLHEVSRVAGGELPYRDFSFQYPPLSAFFFGWGLRWFGTTFTVAAILENLCSVSVMLLAYVLTTWLLPRQLRVPTCFLLAAVGATSLTNFNLFSYRIYSPALQIGTAGTLLSLWGILRWLCQGHPGKTNQWMIVIGTTVAFLSKPEFALAGCYELVLFAIAARNLRTLVAPSLGFLAACVLPAALLYAWLAGVTGLRNLLGGVSGYGLATYSCPWWPTGIGVFGVLAAIGEACFVGAIISLPWRQRFADHLGRTYQRLWMAAIPGVTVFAAYVIFLNIRLMTSDKPLFEKMKQILPSIAWSAPVLLPVMWTVIILFLYLLFRLIKGNDTLKARTEQWKLLLILAVPVAICPRTLFGSTQGTIADVPAACYPFFLILGPYLLWKFLSSVPDRGGGTIPAAAIVSVLALGYGAARIVGGGSLLTDRAYRTLATEAGVVKIGDFDSGIPIYDYVIGHTGASDYVLELPYGGGINFASHRRNPIFDTQLFGMAMPPKYQQMDLDRIREHQPKVIVVQDAPNLGTFYGYGSKGDRMCVCPRLVWEPDRQSWAPGVVFPVVEYIQNHYRVEGRYGQQVILIPAEIAEQAWK